MDKNLSTITAEKILSGFETHYKSFRESSVRAKKYFEKRQWMQLLKDSKHRIYFYDKQVKKFCKDIETSINISQFDETLWVNTKLAYINLIATCNQPELAETFYNSMFCRLFDKRFYNNNFIFVRPGISTTFIDIDNPVITSYYIKNKNLETIIKSILNSFCFDEHYENIDRDAQRLAKQLIKQTNLLEGQSCEIQMISSPFFRRKASYLIGKIVSHNNTSQPLLIAVLNDEKTGLYVDALLTDISSISMVFSFSRSYFFINTRYPAAIVDFLKSILPTKTKAYLYSAIGLHKHGKTLLYRTFLKYSKVTDEKLIIAPGIKGMVMTVFTFPMFSYVFKVINDKFSPSKSSTPKKVKDKYFFVKSHCRIGRLADTWEFSNVAFPIRDLGSDLLKELTDKVGSSISIEGDLLIIKHLYMENKMIPLNLYINNANDKQLAHIINDYGCAIDELINADIFPGDMLTKNFGVTRQNRVVFYDYDEITPMNKPVFRKIPTAKYEEDEMASEPWYYVGPNDVFPEEFKFFMFSDHKNRQIFNQHYKKLLDVDYWQTVQNSLRQGNSKDYYPYKAEYRMSEIYNTKS
jgi:isocitrate dehydrogenase kinase/phosphatase